MKNIISLRYIMVFLFLSMCTFLKAQEDCNNLQDPLFDFEFDIDLCCEVPECYPLDKEYLASGEAEETSTNCFSLTPDLQNKGGLVMSTTTINLNKPFCLSAYYNFGEKDYLGADGIVFMFAQTNDVLGQDGGGIGYGGIDNSFGWEVDTYYNSGFNDPSETNMDFDHMAISRDGNIDHGSVNNLVDPILINDVEDGMDHYVTINWDPITMTFTAHLDGLQITYTGDIISDIFNEDPNVYFGFSAATGHKSNNHTICIIDPSICEITEPNMDFVLDPTAPVENISIFDGEAGDISTSDVISGSTGDTTGPSMDIVGNILNAMVTSGALPNGAGCFNLNCIDLASMSNQFENSGPDSYGAYLDEEIEITSDMENDLNGMSMSEYLQSHVGNIIQEEVGPYGNFTNYLNAQLGLQIPDQGDCELDPDSNPYHAEYEYDPDPLDKDEVSQSRMGPETEADLDYFNSEIAGLGLKGPGATLPSPASLEMIKNANGGVDLYNGSQQTSIPLYTVSSNDISLPISVNSNNNGLKVDDLGTLLGQNWNLAAGGSISRIVKGLPDEYHGTTKSIGVGRTYEIKARFEMPSGVGLRVDFPGAGAGCAIPIADIVSKQIFKKQTPAIYFSGHWTPLKPNLITFAVGIRIPLPWPLIKLYLTLDFNAGIALNQKFDNIYFEEEGLGFSYLDELNGPEAANFDLSGIDLGPESATTKISQLSLEDMHRVVEKANAHQKFDDEKFFSTHFATYQNWLDGFKDLVGVEKVYESKKLDTEADQFHFNFGNYSGHFYLEKDGTPVIFPCEDLKITHNTTSLSDGTKVISSFQVYTPEGMEYTFGRDDLYAVDIQQDTNYYLPNFYTYPEDGTNLQQRDKFKAAQIEQTEMVNQPFFGPKNSKVWGNTYNRNYRISPGPQHSSSWHLTKVRSLLSQEVVDLNYESRGELNYYTNKSFTHTFPNFKVQGEDCKTIPNTDLEIPHIKPTRWENGRAELAYNVNKTQLDAWRLSVIETPREERARFFYDEDRAEIVGDKLCDSIVIERNDAIYKGWAFDYTYGSAGEDVEFGCDPIIVTEPDDAPVSVPGGFSFNLGELDELAYWERFTYFFFNFRVSCLTIPIRIHFPQFYDGQVKDFGYRTHLNDGSLYEVMGLNGLFDMEAEQAIYNAEKKRSFLHTIRELDKEAASHPHVELEYHGNFLTDLPEKFSFHQDLFGYYNDNSQTMSPIVSGDYQDVFGNPVAVTNSARQNHYAFFNEAALEPNNTYLGLNKNPDYSRANIGAVKKLTMASGGSYSYFYELNQLPSGAAGAGLRVSDMIENPGGSPAKQTSYEYSNPTVINDPIHVWQHSDHIYYWKPDWVSNDSGFEQKVRCSSKPMNDLLANKNNHVGYENVTEYVSEWGGEGFGKIEHHYSTPANLNDIGEHMKFDIPNYPNLTTGIKFNVEEFREGMGNDNLDLSLPFTEINEPRHEQINLAHFNTSVYGLELENNIYNAGGDLVETNENVYKVLGACETENNSGSSFQSSPEPEEPCRKGNYIKYYKTSMIQNNFQGTFFENYAYRLISQYLPYYEDIVLLIDFIMLIADGNTTPHIFNRIERTYQVDEYSLFPVAVVMEKNTKTDYFVDLSSTKVETEYEYVNYNKTKSVLTKYNESGGSNYGSTTTYQEMVYPFEDSGITDAYFSAGVIDYLNLINYQVPIHSTTKLNGVLTEQSFTGLGLQFLNSGFQIIPVKNYGLRSGVLYEIGKFSSWNLDGKPKVYEQALHNNAGYFSPIKLNWNTQLQLINRSYIDFATSYNYNSYFELVSTIDPDDISASYTYDLRGRLATAINMNGRQTTKHTYNIGPGDNWANSMTHFTDGAHPPQGAKTTSDGFGKTLNVRRQDGALLSQSGYDALSRIISTYAIGNGQTNITYEASLIPRFNTSVDAEDNSVYSELKGDEAYFTKTTVLDPNGDLAVTRVDGLGRRHKLISGVGGITETVYDELGRLKQIINPIGETYNYTYNQIGTLSSKKTPGQINPQKYYWNIAFRPVAQVDAKGQTNYMQYDDYNRVTKISYTETSSLGDEAAISGISGFGLPGDLVQQSNYANGHTWLQSTNNRVFTETGMGGWKKSVYPIIDDIGRPIVTQDYYQEGFVVSTFTHTDANLIINTKTNVWGPELVNYDYTFGFDDVLRPKSTFLDVNGDKSFMVSEFEYNEFDQLELRKLGESEAGNYLQNVDYTYNAIGDLLTINDVFQEYCTNEEIEVCDFKASFKILLTSCSNQGWDCNEIHGVEVDGVYYPFSDIIELCYIINPLEEAIQEVLEPNGFAGTVTLETEVFSGVNVYNLTIEGANFNSINLMRGDCAPIEFEQEDCCVVIVDTTSGGSGGGGSGSDDLYTELITYEGWNISRIEQNTDCISGWMQNDFLYDLDHRVKRQTTTLFQPEQINNAYNTKYGYDLAGNISGLSRRGLVNVTDDGPEYGMIDYLGYNYEGSQLNSVTDQAGGIGQPKGFKPLSSSYNYDANGNIIYDSGKGLVINYNPLNLPNFISGPNGTLSVHYSFDGEKIKKISTEKPYERLYLGDVEYRNGEVEFLSHSEGRVFFDKAKQQHWQYRIGDHLNNNVVNFEDKDGDGEILTAVETDDPELVEVLQENRYYPFGMEMDGTWDHLTNPRHSYLYNDKELDRDLGLNWHNFGFRMYDAAIGRFPSVDPIADQYAHANPFNYAENEPVGHIDLWGLQQEDPPTSSNDEGGVFDNSNDGVGTWLEEAVVTASKPSEYQPVVTDGTGSLHSEPQTFEEDRLFATPKNLFAVIRDDGGIIGGMAYNFVDPLYVSFMDILPLPSNSHVRHLDGTYADRKARELSLINSSMTFLPTLRGAIAAKGTVYATRGVTIFSRISNSKFDKIFKGTPFARMTRKNRIKLKNFINEADFKVIGGIKFINLKVSTGNILLIPVKTGGNAAND